jgi:hypothetical protein
VQYVYTQAALYIDRKNYSELGSTDMGLDTLRASLGHPLFSYSYSARCVVSGVNGLDAASARERFVVVSRLWAEGIPAEYLAQSGVMASLLRQQREDTQGPGTSVRSRFCVLKWLPGQFAYDLFVSCLRRIGHSMSSVVFAPY